MAAEKILLLTQTLIRLLPSFLPTVCRLRYYPPPKALVCLVTAPQPQPQPQAPHSLSLSLSLSLCTHNIMSQPLRIHYHSSSYSSTHNDSSYSYYVQSSSFPSSSSSSSSLSLTSSTSPSSPISISFTSLYSPLTALPQQHHELGDSPISIQLTPISSDDQFDQLLAHTHHDQHPLIIVWMANWCRKCIYLKPKLEKLAAEYYPRLLFYTVDVNTVSHKLVARAGVTKMPTIQLWKDGKKQAEVIGGHNAYWVIGDVQEMIENECKM